MVGCSALLDSL